MHYERISEIPLIQRMCDDLTDMQRISQRLRQNGVGQLIVTSGYALEGLLGGGQFERFHFDCDFLIITDKDFDTVSGLIQELMPDWISYPTETNCIWLQNQSPPMDSNEWESRMRTDSKTVENLRAFNIHVMQSDQPFGDSSIPITSRRGKYTLNITAGEFTVAAGAPVIELPILTLEMQIIFKLRAWHTLRNKGHEIREKDIIDLKLLFAFPEIDFDLVRKHLIASLRSPNPEADVNQLLAEARSIIIEN